MYLFAYRNKLLSECALFYGSCSCSFFPLAFFSKKNTQRLDAESLKIQPLTEGVFVHISYFVEQVKRAYPDVRFVIPGHGATGGVELLDFTARLFQEGR